MEISREAFKKARAKANLSQQKASNLIGMTKRQIQLYEGGYCKIPVYVYTHFLLMTNQDEELFSIRESLQCEMQK